MRNSWKRGRWLMPGLLIALAAAGCFQQSGTSLEPLSVVSLGPTFTPIASDTPLPPPELESPTPEPLPTETPTADSFALALPTATLDFNGAAIAQLPTEAPALPLQPAEIDPVFLTATAIIERATATEAFNLTATAMGGFVFPTETPALPVIEPTAPGIGGITGVDCVHEVRVEDRNLYRISLRYGVPVMDIARASGIANPNLIIVGQRLTIPGCGTTGAFPPPTSTPGTGGTGTGTGVGTTYVVQQGDTLFKISLRFGVPVVSIAAANGITDINRIYINQQLIIPSS